ncbi:MAG: hypothetical protein IJC17_05510 [Clostridia bacterium]|nr:hypothetical protein [Clostridia bacterium]
MIDQRYTRNEVSITETIKGILETTIQLGKTSCYFMKTGKCSLSLIGDFYLSPSVRLTPSDLMYCPRLYQQMQGKDKNKPINIVPCECGHAEVVSGPQRACIASQKRLPVPVAAAGEGEETYPLCSVCGSQMTFDESDVSQVGGVRIVTVHAVIERSEKPEEK